MIGAGVMGAGIAAQVANSGTPVVLLDIVPRDLKEGGDRSAVAKGAIEKMLKTEPAAFMSKAAAKLVTPGNIEDDLALLADCDWIVEAIVERLDLKQGLYAKIEAVRKDGSIVSSNTSTIPLATLTGGLPARFAQDFCITHFFNPPRYMRLLEVVKGEATRADAIADVSRFADVKLGKSVVACKDRPGFIANRLGVMWMQAAVVEAFERKMDVEDVDQIIGRPFGIPKTGVFGLFDLVGLDLMPHVNASLAAALPEGDMFHEMNRPVPLVPKMIAEGFTGRKGKGGFYRVNREKGKRKETIDLATGEYRVTKKADVEAVKVGSRSLAKLFDHDSEAGRYAWAVMGRTLCYAALLVGDAADEIESFDEAMRLGYNWKKGPFELIDQIGTAEFVRRLEASGLPVAPILRTAAGKPFYQIVDGKREALELDGRHNAMTRPEGVLMLEDVKLASQPVLKNGSAALWDVGDGVACFEFTSKMNSLDPDIIALLQKSIAKVKKDFKALVIYNEGSQFSVGANLGLALFAANIAAWPEIENLIASGQQTYKALKYAPFPVVAAPSGMALGGRLRDPAPLRRHPGPCRDLHRPRRGRRRPHPRLGRLQGDAGALGEGAEAAQGTDADPRPGLRDDLHRQGGEIRGRGQGDADPAAGRRHHHEPLPAPRRRQGQGAVDGGGLSAAGAAGLPSRRPLGRRRARHGRRRLLASGQGD